MLLITAAVVGCIMLLAMDATFQANGLYGSRTLTVEKVLEKRLLNGRRNAKIPHIYFNHRGQRLDIRVLREEYDAITVGERLPVVIVPSRISGQIAFLDRPGIKHSPESRMAFFVGIVALHFGLLFGLFHYLLRRARQREHERLQGFETGRLGSAQR